MSITSLMPTEPREPVAPRNLLVRLWNWSGTPDSAALHGLISGALWFLIGTSIGLIMSNELTMPDLFEGIAPLTFSRLRPIHVNMVVYGFLATSFYGGWYFLVPRMCKAPLQTNRIANFLLLFWNIAIFLGSLAIAFGDTSGREYTEYPWYIDWAAEVLLVLNIYIVFATIAARREPRLYVSLWYIGGTTIWIASLWAIGHVIWHPFTTYIANGHSHVLWGLFSGHTSLPEGATITDFQRTGAIRGLDDAVWNWFYGHNVLGLFATTGGIAIVYYLVPKISKRPLFSHSLSLIGFWTIALFYTETGQHHLLQAPIPNWLKTVAIVGSVSLVIPVFAFFTNILMTMRNNWTLALSSIPLRFILTGTFFYTAVSFQGSVQSLMTVNRFIHFTQWVIAHAHLALLGAFGFISCGAILYMVPQIVRRPLWSRNLADAQYWLMLIGITGYFWSITAAGLAQASAWVLMGEQVVKVIQVVKPYFVMRSWFGALIVIGVVMQVINVYMTIKAPPIDAAERRRKGIAELVELPILPAQDESTTLTH